MSQLEDLLHDAADGSVGFDHRDIGRRVRHRRRTKVAAVAAAVVLGAVGIVAGTGDDEQVVDSAGPVVDGAVTVDELVGDRWVAMAYSAVMVGPNRPAYLEFTDDGRLAGIDGCDVIDGTWDLDGTRLLTDLEPTEDIPCANETGGLLDILEADPTVSRFDAGMLELRSGEVFVAFERFDRLGEPPTTEALAGTWTPGAGDETAGQVTLDPDGTGVLEILDCSQSFEWSLDGDRLLVDGLDRSGVPCGDGIVGGGLLYTLTGSPRLRASDSTLWVSSDLGVALLRSTGADPGAATTTTAPGIDPSATAALQDAARTVPFVTAGPEGVVLHDGPAPTRISDGPAAVAFAVGADIVVHQAASADFPQYPLSPDGVPQVWVSGERRDLPVASDAVRARLLDARSLDGVPVALLAESYGGVGPDDTFEALVLVDLETLDRRTVVRRPSWESGHINARVLPDGDIIGLFGAESLVILARWSPGIDEPVWSAEVATDRGTTLTMVDGQIRVIAGGFTDDLTPVLEISSYGLDGTGQGEDTVTVADPAAELGTGLFCTGWYDPAHVVCGRSDGPPIVASTTAGAFQPLPAAAGSYPTVVR